MDNFPSATKSIFEHAALWWLTTQDI